MHTAHAMNEEKAKSFDTGFDEYLTKPIDKPRLFEILKHYIGKTRRGVSSHGINSTYE